MSACYLSTWRSGTVGGACVRRCRRPCGRGQVDRERLANPQPPAVHWPHGGRVRRQPDRTSIVPAMAISWEWLQPLITTPYVPALGPAHPQAVTPGRFLPHDKDRRWADRKDEQVLPESIIQGPSLVMIPTLRTGRASCIRVYIYSRQPQSALNQAAALGRRLCEQHDAAKGRLSWFLPPGSDPDPVAACTRTQMRTFSSTQPDTGSEAPAGVVPLNEVPGAVRGTFSATTRSSGRSARWRSCPTAAAPPSCCRSTSGSCLNIAAAASAACSGGPPCTGDSGTRLLTSSCRLKSAAHRTACASRKDSPTSAWSAPPRSEPTPTYPGRPYSRRQLA
jgi:hypothetical protein